MAFLPHVPTATNTKCCSGSELAKQEGGLLSFLGGTWMIHHVTSQSSQTFLPLSTKHRFFFSLFSSLFSFLCSLLSSLFFFSLLSRSLASTLSLSTTKKRKKKKNRHHVNQLGKAPAPAKEKGKAGKGVCGDEGLHGQAAMGNPKTHGRPRKPFNYDPQRPTSARQHTSLVLCIHSLLLFFSSFHSLSLLLLILLA